MDIKGLIEWVGKDLGSTIATLYPYGILGLVALYLLYLVIGYLRVSQVGLEPAAGRSQAAVPLPETSGAALAAPRGVPYCPVDRLQFPPEARFCPVCEADLLLACVHCGTTIRAADESCYRCGARQAVEAPAY